MPEDNAASQYARITENLHKAAEIAIEIAKSEDTWPREVVLHKLRELDTLRRESSESSPGESSREIEKHRFLSELRLKYGDLSDAELIERERITNLNFLKNIMERFDRITNAPDKPTSK